MVRVAGLSSDCGMKNIPVSLNGILQTSKAFADRYIASANRLAKQATYSLSQLIAFTLSSRLVIIAILQHFIDNNLESFGP